MKTTYCVPTIHVGMVKHVRYWADCDSKGLVRNYQGGGEVEIFS